MKFGESECVKSSAAQPPHPHLITSEHFILLISSELIILLIDYPMCQFC